MRTKRLFIGLILLIGLILFVSAADFTPQGNINLRGVYNITGAPFVNATLFYGNGSQLVGVTADASGINHTLLAALQGGSTDEYYHINESQHTSLLANIFDWLLSTGDTMTGDLNFSNSGIYDVSFISLNTTQSDPAHLEGLIFYDQDSLVPSFYTSDPDVKNSLGLEIWKRVRNTGGVQINNGDAVYIKGSTGLVAEVGLAISSDITKSGVIGLATEDIADNAFGWVTIMGDVHNLNTTIFSEGDVVYLSDTIVGAWTNVAPSAPNFAISIGEVTKSHVNQGTISVHPSPTDVLNHMVIQDLTINNNFSVLGNITTSGFYFGNGSQLDISAGDITNDGTYYLNSNPYTYWNDTYATFNQTFADERYLTGQLSLFFYNESDSVNNSYTIMNATINPTLQSDTFSGLSDGDNLLTNRILSSVDLSILETGAYNQHTTIDYTSGTKDVQLRSTLHILYANGTEFQIGSSPVSPVLATGTYQQIIWTGVIDTEVIFGASDYLTMYLYAFVSGGGSAPTLDLVVGGSTSARLDIGINPTDISVVEVDPVFTAWDNFTGIPHATPSSGDVTSFSWAGEIYDWAVGLFLQNVVQDTTPQLGGYLDTNTQNIGSTTDEIENIYMATNSRIYWGDGQEMSQYFNGTHLITG